jgi:hypothetical protein
VLPGLTSTTALAVAVVAAVAVPVVLGVVVWRALPGAPGPRTGRTAGVVALCVVGQCCALAAVFLGVNDSYGFYAGYGDLLGHSTGVQPIRVNTGQRVSGGRFDVLDVHGAASHTTAQVLVWLPAQYDEPAYRHHRFPVVEFLPGQPNTPQGLLRHFDVIGQAAALVRQHRIAPFVLVVPPLMIRPPADTECTDVPHGPRALAWLKDDVPHAVAADLRVDPPGQHWGLIGWSTGGFCAAKLVLSDPHAAGAAASLGGYYQPDTHHVYPNLFGGSAAVRRANSPEDLYRLHGLRGDRLLMVAGREDPESWPSTRRMLAATRGDPDVSFVAMRDAGHNTTAYARYVGPALTWLAGFGA